MRVHDNAFLSLVRGEPELANVTFEGVVTERPEKYVAVFANDSRAATRFTGPQRSVEAEFIVHSIGKTPEQAKWVRERIYSRVLGVTPTITGWRCGRIRFVASQPLGLDKDITPPLFYMVDVFAFDSEPA